VLYPAVATAHRALALSPDHGAGANPVRVASAIRPEGELAL
jgi:hypothetical protein